MFSIFEKEDISKRDITNLFMLIMISSGIFGFIYETIFYRIDLGYFVKRGSTYGPWIPIYVFGGLFITLLTYKYKEKPLMVFIIGMLVSGLLEYGTGYYLDKYMGIRLWNYYEEICNFGNINGYICLRSVLFFGFSSLILIYLIIPFLLKYIKSVRRSYISMISYMLFITFSFDFIIYIILHR